MLRPVMWIEIILPPVLLEYKINEIQYQNLQICQISFETKFYLVVNNMYPGNINYSILALSFKWLWVPWCLGICDIIIGFTSKLGVISPPSSSCQAFPHYQIYILKFLTFYCFYRRNKNFTASCVLRCFQDQFLIKSPSSF